LIVQVFNEILHGLLVGVLVNRNFALTEFLLMRLHCTLWFLISYQSVSHPALPEVATIRTLY